MITERFELALDCIKKDVLRFPPANKVDLGTKYLIAYSGGMDSHVLLKLCSDLKLNIRAVYINHGLQAEADAWQQHCFTICQQMQIEYEAIKVDASPISGQSREETARLARYKALEANITDGECLLTAHHRDDQAETFLLQLMRGSGTAGLAAMPKLQTFGCGWHARPMLDMSRDELQQYAELHKLLWVNDPSNKDVSFDRNFIRQKVFPLFVERWSHASRSIKQAADIQQESLALAQDLASIDLANIAVDNSSSLSIQKLMKLSDHRQFNVLRFWVKQARMDKPTRKIIQQILSTVVTAAEDAEPLVAWSNTEVRRFKEVLYILPSSPDESVSTCYSWSPVNSLRLDQLNLVISSQQNVSHGLSANLLNHTLTVCFRQGGEKIKPAGRQHTVSLKKLMQQAEIPPWQRSRIPLIYKGDDLICVCGYWLAHDYASVAKNSWIPVVDTI